GTTGQQGQGGSAGQPALVIVGRPHADNMDIVPAAGADDLEEIQFAVQAFVLVQADNQWNVFEKTRGLADLVAQIGFKLVVVEVVQLQRGQRHIGAFSWKLFLSPQAQESLMNACFP